MKDSLIKLVQETLKESFLDSIFGGDNDFETAAQTVEKNVLDAAKSSPNVKFENENDLKVDLNHYKAYLINVKTGQKWKVDKNGDGGFEFILQSNNSSLSQE